MIHGIRMLTWSTAMVADRNLFKKVFPIWFCWRPIDCGIGAMTSGWESDCMQQQTCETWSGSDPAELLRYVCRLDAVTDEQVRNRWIRRMLRLAAPRQEFAWWGWWHATPVSGEIGRRRKQPWCLKSMSDQHIAAPFDDRMLRRKRTEAPLNHLLWACGFRLLRRCARLHHPLPQMSPVHFSANDNPLFNFQNWQRYYHLREGKDSNDIATSMPWAWSVSAAKWCLLSFLIVEEGRS